MNDGSRGGHARKAISMPGEIRKTKKSPRWSRRCNLEEAGQFVFMATKRRHGEEVGADGSRIHARRNHSRLRWTGKDELIGAKLTTGRKCFSWPAHEGRRSSSRAEVRGDGPRRRFRCERLGPRQGRLRRGMDAVHAADFEITAKEHNTTTQNLENRERADPRLAGDAELTWRRTASGSALPDGE